MWTLNETFVSKVLHIQKYWDIYWIRIFFRCFRVPLLAYWADTVNKTVEIHSVKTIITNSFEATSKIKLRATCCFGPVNTVHLSYSSVHLCIYHSDFIPQGLVTLHFFPPHLIWYSRFPHLYLTSKLLNTVALINKYIVRNLKVFLD